MYAVLGIGGGLVVVFGPFQSRDLADAWQAALDHNKTGLRARTTYEVVPLINPHDGGEGICMTPPPPLESI